MRHQLEYREISEGELEIRPELDKYLGSVAGKSSADDGHI